MSDKDSVLGHKPGLFVLFFTEMWERFSYYGMRALLVLFLVSQTAAGGWEWSRADALSLYGLYTGLVYLTPIIGGMLADKVFGYKNAVIIGAFLMTLGHASMALETEATFYLGLGLLILGNGMFKPNISSIVGQLYKNEENKKDAAYTVFYMGINAGAFLGILFCGYVGEKVGWNYGFGLAGIFMFFGMLQFWLAQGIFGDIGKKTPDSEVIDEMVGDELDVEKELQQLEEQDKIERDRLIVIGVLSFFTIFFWVAFEQAGGSMTIFANDYTNRVLTGNSAIVFFWTDTVLTVAPVVIVTYVLFKLFRKTFSVYWKSNLFLGISFVLIWGLTGWRLNKEFNTKAYEITYTKGEKTERVTLREDADLDIGSKISIVDIDGKGRLRYLTEEEGRNFKGKIEAEVIKVKEKEIEVAATWFGILNSFFIIIFAPVFSKIWQTKLNPSGPIKFALGLILLGLGFVALAWGGMSIEKGAQTASVGMQWLCIAYLLHTLGELCLSPVGLSYVSKLAPQKLVGLMFGVWFGATALANYLAGWTGSLIDDISAKYSISTFLFGFAFLPIGAAIILIILNPMLKRMMHGIK